MKSNKRTHRLIVATLALAMGSVMLFWGHKINGLARLDHAAAYSSDNSSSTLHSHDSKTDTITLSSITKDTNAARSYQHIHVTDDPERIFESSPPSALDYAIILESLHNHGYRDVNITIRLNWESDPGLLAAGLDLRLALFDSVIIPFSLTRGPQEGSLPIMLERSMILPSQIKGDNKLIPLVNRTALTPQFKGEAKGALAGFHSIEHNPPTPGHVAMLARWSNKGMLPSYELLTLMQAHKVAPKEVEIHCGKHIRLGKQGPVIAIDQYGQTKIPTPLPTSSNYKPLDADTLITQKKSDTLQQEIAIIHAQGRRTSPTNAINSERLMQVIAMTNAYPAPSEHRHHRRLPVWAELIILFDIAIIVFWLRSLPRSNQHLGFALTSALMLPMLYALMSMTQHWMAISVPLAALLTGWLLPFSNRQSTSGMHEYHTSDPKPVIRA